MLEFETNYLIRFDKIVLIHPLSADSFREFLTRVCYDAVIRVRLCLLTLMNLMSLLSQLLPQLLRKRKVRQRPQNQKCVIVYLHIVRLHPKY